MSIAIIIVNYRTGDLVIDHLPAIRSEMASVPHSHLYIVDNASPGGDAEKLARATEGLGDVTCIAAPRNGGFSYGNNLGISKAFEDADYDHIYLLNPDAVPHPGCLSTLLAFLDEHPKAGIVGSRLQGTDGAPQCSAFRFHSIGSEIESTAGFGPISRILKNHIIYREVSETAHESDWVCGASMLMKKDVIDQIGLMDEAYFLYFEEVDFQRAARQAGFEIWYVPEAKAIHLVGQSTDMKDSTQSSGRAPDYWYDSRRYYFNKNHGRLYAWVADLAFLAGKFIRSTRGLLTGKKSDGVIQNWQSLRAAAKRQKVA